MSELMYPSLFSPITIRGKTYRNRICVAPLGAEIPNEGANGAMSDQAINFYRDVARGGCARVMSGENDIIYGCAVHAMYAFCEAEPTELLKDSFRRYAQACHEEGALAFTSFSHTGVFGHADGGDGIPGLPGMEPPAGPGGGVPPTDLKGMPPMPPAYVPKDKNGRPMKRPDKIYGPSDMILTENYDGYSRPKFGGMGSHDGLVIHGATREQMEEFADALAHCAKVAKDCGLDGINIHSGHGFMFSQWLSPRFNKRTDEFGGSFENRCRFPIMVLQRVREAVGEEFIIEMRWSGEENCRPLSDHLAFEHMLSVEDSVRFFQELDKYPGLLDIAHISAGLHHNALYNSRTISNFYYPEGLNLECAAAVKAAVKNIRVGVVGGMTDPALCDRAIADGKVDFVIMARQLLIADPAFARKAYEGKPEFINNCLRCAQCRLNGHCTVNPVNLMTCSEEERQIKKTVEGKKLVIVGGGIAGMKAAEFAAARGFRVILFEKERELGGILRYADFDRFKTTLKRYKDNVAKRIAKMGVDIRLGHAVTPEEVKAEHADAVIVATGGKPAQLKCPCKAGANVLDATTAYLHPEKVGQKVVVVGGGLTGCEAAIHWGDQGRKVTLLSRSPQILKNFGPPNGTPFDSVETYLLMFENTGVELYEGYACVSVTEKGVTARGAAGEVFIPADTVINCAGMVPVPDAAAPFEGTAPVVKPVGDCVVPTVIGAATYGAYQAVMLL